jgi:hypothetical protein
MERNASLYSFGGSADLAANVALGTYASYSSNPIADAVVGNRQKND